MSQYGEKVRALTRAMKQAKAAKAPPMTVMEWAAKFNTSRTYVYQIANLLGFYGFFAYPYGECPPSKISVSYRGGVRVLQPVVNVPTRAIRKAGFCGLRSLTMIVEPGRIVIVPASPQGEKP